MITGEKNGYLSEKDPKTDKFITNAALEKPGAFRGGAIYGGVIYKGYSYFGGTNSEKVLHTVQNQLHRWFGTKYYFQDLKLPSKPWSYFGNYSNMSLIY
jgi:hypothetical protein